MRRPSVWHRFTARRICHFIGGNLLEDFTTEAALGRNNRITDEGTNKLTLTITPGTGLFRGTVMRPGGTRSMSFSGALFQKPLLQMPDIAYGFGFHLGTNQSGQIRLAPRQDGTE